MAALDKYPQNYQMANTNDNVFGPSYDAVAITPSDSTSLTTAAKGLYVGSIGDVTVVTMSGNTVTFVGCPTGTILPIRFTRVNSTGTTASSLTAFL